MEFMPWLESYSVRVTQVDNQHKRLVGLINGLHEVMLAGGSPSHVEAVLQDLVAYTGTHFADEEALMAKAAYAGLAAHQLKHKAMRAEVERLVRDAGTSHTGVSIKLMNFLKAWLAKHICQTDRDYVPALKAAGID